MVAQHPSHMPPMILNQEPEKPKPQIQNLYNVPKRQWKKWSRLSKLVFNSTFGWASNNQLLSVHPDTTLVPPERWRTTAWNLSWAAADAASLKFWSDVGDGEEPPVISPQEMPGHVPTTAPVG